jgi:hypothetical protein
VAGLVLALHSAIEGVASNTETVSKNAFHHGRLIHLLSCGKRIATCAAWRDSKRNPSGRTTAHLDRKHFNTGMQDEGKSA